MKGEERTAVQVYCDVLPEQLGALERIAGAADANGALSVYAWRLLCETALRMARTARTVGFETLAGLLEDLDALAHAYSMAPAQAGEQARAKVRDLIAHIHAYGLSARPEQSRLWRACAGAADEAGASLAGAAILFVDEDPLARRIAQARLQASGAHAIMLAGDGRDALAQADPAQPYAIVADWRTAPMGGLELLMEVRKGRTHMRADTPFVLLKRAHEREALRAGIRAGADYFLIKPFTEAALIRAIACAAQRRPAPPSWMAQDRPLSAGV